MDAEAGAATTVSAQRPRVGRVKVRLASGLYDRMQALADEMRAELVKAPRDAEQIARKLNVTFANVPKAGAGDPLPLIGASKDLDDSIFSLPKGEVTPVVQVPGNKLALAVVSDIMPARPAELAEVENVVRTQVVERKVRQVVEQKAIAPDGPIQQQVPNEMIKLSNGRVVNAGLIAAFYDHGYPQSYIDLLIQNEIQGT